MSRGQAHTLEGTIASLLLVVSLLVALQSTAVTPLTASTSSQQIENQLAASARGVLAAAEEDNALKPATLYWNETNGSFHDVPSSGYYVSDPPDNSLGRMLNATFDSRSIAYNVILAYNGSDDETRYIYRGEPSDNAVSVTRTVVLFDGDHLRTEAGAPNRTVAESSSFYAPDAGRNVYNVVTVRVVVWRI
ncbi:MAG: hypothetical protein ABEH56_01145 [Salinirussus sp.]